MARSVRLLSVVLIAGAVIAAGGLGLAVASTAESEEHAYQEVWSDGEPEEFSLLSLEERAGVARTARLWPTWDELQELEGFVDGGYESVTSDRLMVHWKGARTPELDAVLEAARERGLESVVVDVDFSAEEFSAAVLLLAAELQEAGVAFDGVGPLDRYQGLFIELPSFNAPHEAIVLAERIARETLPDIPVTVRVIERALPPAEGESYTFAGTAISNSLSSHIDP